VFVQLLPGCEMIRHRRPAYRMGCWVFCLSDLSELRVPDEYVPESNPKVFSNFEGERLTGRFSQPRKRQ
jgi:hypothetical protein